jgi:tetratricopeptide (TPR) repeat protein
MKDNKSTVWLVEELNGYVDLGMQQEVLALARHAFNLDPLAPDLFNAALQGILIHADPLQAWVPMVESAYAKLPERGRRAVRAAMLNFYWSLADWEGAARFLPPRLKSDSGCLMVMDVLLVLDRLDEAGLLARKCSRALTEAGEPFEKSQQLEALANYCAQCGQWEIAQALWEHAPLDDPLARNAMIGLARVHLARALAVTRMSLQAVKTLKQDWDPEQETMLPGNQNGLLGDWEKELSELHDDLEKLLPADCQKEFGLAGIGPSGDALNEALLYFNR